jgi:hypothetical protein
MVGKVLSRVVLCLLSAGLAAAVSGPAVVLAAPLPGVVWKVSLVAQPTSFAVSARASGEPVDQYVLVLTNVGGVASSGPVRVTDTLPAGVTVGGEFAGAGWNCSHAQGSAIATCVYAGVVGALGQSSVLTIPVAVAKSGALTDSVVVSGGGAPVATANVSTVAGADSPPFGFLEFDLQTSTVSGMRDIQAGDRPYALTTALEFPQREGTALSGKPEQPVQTPKAAEIELPAGLIGDPRAGGEVQSRCTIAALFADGCPPSARVGTFFVNLAQGVFSQEQSAYPIYDLVPERGHLAEFGLVATGIEKAVLIYGDIGPPPAYRLRLSVPDIPASAELGNAIVTFFGGPQDMDGVVNAPVAFFTNPSDCSGAPLVTNVTAYTWEQPHAAVFAEAQAAPVAGCDLLRFEPSISLTPETTLADEPSGYTVDMGFPQAPPTPEALATPPVKNITLRLPQGVSVNPSAADGLAACPAEGREGINIAGPLSEEEGPNGEQRTALGHCPLASQVGTVEAVTPLLAEPLRGRMYVAAPGCGGSGQGPCVQADALDGNLYGLYLQLEGPGVVIKLRGIVSADPANGELTASFREAPQLPIADLRLTFKGGPRALLANPQSCGAALTRADLTPWSSPETADATPSFAFPVTGCGGPQFTPTFLAGTTGATGGAYTSFTFTFSRSDRQQSLGQLQVRTPPGLLVMLSHLASCEEPQAAAGKCSSASAIGTATVGAGAGSHPFWVSGPVYLTGPYHGAPFGVSIAIAAQVGPFNLGALVVRAALNIDPHTAALTFTSGPLPQILDGMPLRAQTLNVTIDRPRFMFNPTNCNALQVTAKLASAEGALAYASVPFAAGGCKYLPFRPKLTALTRANGELAGHGASLHVVIATTARQANIRSLKVDLPQRLPARLETIQHACPEGVFERNPAACPPASVIGSGTAATPVLGAPMRGPAFLVAHGVAAFPDMVLVLQAQGVRIDLTGALFVDQHNVTSTTFRTIPDVPIRRLDLVLPEGRSSVLAASASLCSGRLHILTAITGQNGARVKPTVKVAVAGCKHPKKHHYKKKRRPTHRRRATQPLFHSA